MNVNVEALEDVIESVQKRPKKQFNMGTWRCGTVCCAWGSFVEAYGEKYEIGFHDPYDNIVSCAFERRGELVWDGYKLASEILGIPYRDAWFLFALESYTDSSKPAVLARLREYLSASLCTNLETT